MRVGALSYVHSKQYGLLFDMVNSGLINEYINDVDDSNGKAIKVQPIGWIRTFEY